MALVDLTVQVMLELSAAWLHPHANRPLLEAIPLADALLPKLDSAHKALEATQVGNIEGGAPLLDLVNEASETDGLHDRKVRGIYGFLTALADLADHPIDLARYIDLRNALFPEGLEIADLSYNDEADSALMVHDRLSASQKRLLQRLPLPWGTLMDEVDHWKQTGIRLGEIESRWRVLKRQSTVAAGDGDSSELLHARHNWVRAAQALEKILEIEGLDEEHRDAILGPMYEAEALASSAANRSLAEEQSRAIEEGDVEEDVEEPNDEEIAAAEAALDASLESEDASPEPESESEPESEDADVPQD